MAFGSGVRPTLHPHVWVTAICELINVGDITRKSLVPFVTSVTQNEVVRKCVHVVMFTNVQ